MLNKIFSSISKKSKNKRLIGLDIGSYSVKALGIDFNGTDQKVECLAISEVDRKARQNGRNPEVLTKLIKSCLAEGHIVNKEVVIMVSGAQVFIRRVTMPPMPEEELEEVIPFEVQKYVSLPIDKMAVDYMVVGKKEEDGVNKLDVILVATPKELVEQELSIARDAGLKPVAVSVAPFVQWKAFQLGKKTYEEKVIALLDIGYEKTTISLLNNGILEFTRTIKLGGDEVTNSLMSEPLVAEEGRSRILSYEEAENIKQEHGLSQSTTAGTKTKEGVSIEQIPRLMRPFLEKLLSEIRTSFDFYMTEFQIPKVEKIIMSGGGAELKGLIEFMTGDLGIETELADPFQSTDFTGRASKDDVTGVSSAFVMPLGLAAWEIENLNLLSVKKKNKKVASVTALAAPSCVAAMAMFFFYLNISGGLAGARAELENKKNQLSSLNPATTRVLQLSSQKRKLQAEKDAYPQVLREDIDSGVILKEIRFHTADNIRLEYVNFFSEASAARKKMIKITGTAFFLDKRGSAISDFMTALEESIRFDDVRLINVEQNKDYTAEGLKFQISCLCNTM